MDKVTLAYEAQSGKIIAVLLGENEDFLQLLAGDQGFLRDHGLRDVSGLRAVTADIDRRSFSVGDYRVVEGSLTVLNRIALATDARDMENPNGVPEIKGDGVATCEIVARIIGADGELNTAFTGPVMFSTARGKLSARNGIVRAEAGVAKVTLTSVPETVPPFEIRAEAAGCAPAVLMLEFY